MSFQIDKKKKFGQGFMVSAMVGALAMAFIGLAADSAIAGNGIRKMTPMTEISRHQSNLSAWEYFDVVGLLNTIDGNQVIIGDRELNLASGVSTAGLNLWNLVGANLNDAGEVIALELVSDDPN